VKPLALEDIRDLQQYELERPEFRQRVIALKSRRRVGLGPLLTLVFENRDTVRFQIQEMARIERIARPEKVAQELEVYNELLPGAGEVSATLFIEVTEPEKVQPTLDRFIGLDEPGKLVLRIGHDASAARFAPGQSREDRISAVHYLRFPLGESGRRGLYENRPAVLEVSHSGYEAKTVLSPETVEELLGDLAEEPSNVKV
jgi:hypothetical protein